MLLQVCREVRNFFEISAEYGEFSLVGGKIALDDEYRPGQYLLLSGAFLVSGIYKITEADDGIYTLEGAETDEDWYGTVYGLRVPPDFVALCEQIKAYTEKNAPTGKTSERFGSYSYSRATDASGVAVSWEQVFRKRLDSFRKMFTEIEV